MESCWICFQEDGELIRLCKCPRAVHRKCLASWQLHSAGTREEVECRFCSCKLPEWKLALRPGSTAIAPVVAVVYEGEEYRFRVEPTPDGQARFLKEVEVLLGHPIDLHEVKFHCRGPTGCTLQLKGMESLDAAVYCAAATAAERAARLEAVWTGDNEGWGRRDATDAAAAATAAAAAAAGRLVDRTSIAEGSGDQTQPQIRSSATSHQQRLMPGVEALQSGYLTARPAMEVDPAGNSTTDGSSREVEPSMRLMHRRPTVDGWVMDVSAAQRLPEMAAAWAYLSSHATDSGDATARIRLRRRTVATAMLPGLAIGAEVAAVAAASRSAVSADIEPASTVEHSTQTDLPRPAPQTYSTTGYSIPNSPSGSRTPAASVPHIRNTAAPTAGFCVGKWLTAVVGTVLECLAAKRAENQRTVPAAGQHLTHTLAGTRPVLTYRSSNGCFTWLRRER